MTKHYCDICEEEQERLYHIDMFVHVKDENPLGGHVVMVKGEMEPVSGRTERTECCIVCYNKVMMPLWDTIKALKKP